MTETQIRKYAELMKEMDLTGFEVTEDNLKIRLERGGAGAGAGAAAAPAQTATGTLQESGSRQAQTATDETEYVSIKSPVVGVFYAASAENADPYVAVGDRVAKGQTVCLIEAMKLMTEIQAEDGGTIAEICVANGQVVEYGTELFRVRRSA